MDSKDKMQASESEKGLPGYLRLSIVAVGITLVIVAMVLAKLLLMPLAWAVLLTLMVLPLANWVERRLKNRTISSILTVFMLIAAVGGVLFLLAYQAVGLAKDAPTIAEKVTESVEKVRHFVDEELGMPYAEQPIAVKSELASAAEMMVRGVGSTVQHTFTTLALLVAIPLYMFFLLRYRAHFFQFMIRLVVAQNKAHTAETITKASHVVQKYLRGAGIEVLIVAVMVCILFLIMGIKHALFFAVLVALLNIIPYLGVFIGSMISVVYTFFTMDGLIYPVLVFVFLWVIQIIDNNFVVPYVVGQQIKLNPLAVILVVILGGLIWGVTGMIVFIPFLGILKVVLDESQSLKHYGFLLGDQ